MVARDYRVVGIDPSPTLVGYARREDERADYLIAPGEALPFRDGSFELVVAYNSLQNVDDLSRVVAEAARVLVPEGRLCICVVHPMTDVPNHFESTDPSSSFVVTSYFGPRPVDETVERDGIQMTFRGCAYSLEDYMRALEGAGFAVDLYREPRPEELLSDDRPERAQWHRLPLFLFLRAVKRSAQ
ncbi:MAG TPA: methyltransferase domain-containing protein [Actinomycetota bacterium]|nr:methyltransferase domain-containing protein [Actinomycetota bacterium]